MDDRGFLEMLRDMLSDANPMVVANALAALQEIQQISGRPMLQLTQTNLMKLLTALNDCTEWGQVGTRHAQGEKGAGERPVACLSLTVALLVLYCIIMHACFSLIM